MSQTTQNPTSTTNRILSISDLRSAIHGSVMAPDDPAYDKTRKVFYGSFDRRPAVIVHPKTAADVSYVVSLARDTGIELAVRSGGHSVAGHSTTEGGILLDLSSMKGLEIDAEGRTAWAEAGLTAGEYTQATAAHGLATGFGDTASVGIGGITLGGGIGFLVRKYGMTIDQLLAAEIVTADGQIRQIDAEAEPDLFWAIRGGGGNFGVVTRFQYQLHPVDQIVGGMMIFLATPEIISGFIAAADAASDEFSAIANMFAAPPMPEVPEEHHGKLVIMALMAYIGDPLRAQQVFAPFRALGPLTDMIRPMAYPEMYTLMGMDADSGPAQEVARSFFLDRVDQDVAKTIIDNLKASTAPMAVTQLRVLGGAMARVPSDATAYAHRNRRFMVATGAVYENPDETPTYEAWVTEYASSLQQGEAGVYVNFLGHEKDSRVHDAYPEATWKRLTAIKAQYDPTNVFRLNHNIQPASQVE